jgi:hypothetical protein
MEADDPFRSYVLSAWSRICTVLKQEFVPYLPMVMPIVLQAASLDPKLQFMEGQSSRDQCTGILLMLPAFH